MKNMLKWLSLVVAGGALGFIVLGAVAIVTGARPWQGPPYPDVVAAAGLTQIVPTASEMQTEKMPEGMMKGGMAMGQGMMSGGMMAQHHEATKLIDQLMTSFASIEAEKDPAALKTKLTEHGALLKQLQTKSQECMGMLDKTKEPMMTCPMMGG